MTNEKAIQIMNDNFLGYTLEEIHDAKRHITLALCPDYYKQFESHGVLSVTPNTTEDTTISADYAIHPTGYAYFHGETWYKCPKCGKSFEYYDTQFERGFKHIEGRIYKHTVDDCNQLLDMT